MCVVAASSAYRSLSRLSCELEAHLSLEPWSCLCSGRHTEAAGVPGIMSSLFPPCPLKILWLRFRAGPELNSTRRSQAGDCQFCQFCPVACLASFAVTKAQIPAQAPSDRPDNPVALPLLEDSCCRPGVREAVVRFVRSVRSHVRRVFVDRLHQKDPEGPRSRLTNLTKLTTHFPPPRKKVACPHSGQVLSSTRLAGARLGTVSFVSFVRSHVWPVLL